MSSQQFPTYGLTYSKEEQSTSYFFNPEAIIQAGVGSTSRKTEELIFWAR